MDSRKRTTLARLGLGALCVVWLIGCAILWFEISDTRSTLESTEEKLDAIEEAIFGEVEYNGITFEEAVQRIEKTMNQTELQRTEGDDWSDVIGKRVIWEGSITTVKRSFGDKLLVILYVDQVVEGFLWPHGRAQLYFPESQKENLLFVEEGDWAKFDCKFDYVMEVSVPILEDCRLL